MKNVFNLFKKQKVESQNEVRANKYPAIVEEIHNEFFTAADRLIIEAKQVIANVSTKDAAKANRLNSIGFKQVEQVSKLKPLIEKAELSKEDIVRVKYYAQRYPLNKFITEHQVKIICDKYHLVCAPIDRYLGFVPEKNLAEIERFKVNGPDKAVDTIIITGAWNTGKGNDYLIHSSGGAHIHSLLGMREIPANHESVIWHGVNRDKLFGVRLPSGDTGYVTSYDLTNRQGYFICAPIKEMDLEGLKKTGSIFAISTHKHVPDPVVLQPVKGGYLIVTAWGDEASDENVVNQKMN